MAKLVDYVGIQEAYAAILAAEPERNTVDHTIWTATNGDAAETLFRLYLVACDFMGRCWTVGCEEPRSRHTARCTACQNDQQEGPGCL